ncbi:muramoyltetrapeptide carboxypeptidase [Bordetella trematum]|uniref:Muramoyltetrapeptide carboxypeptidase n=1 Tax=Bordetella trematum TaxID=123899 RepID=A0A157SRT9_9BORD|nr:muramoyltetrapeptide carboxypeptidase [Bordetella trematum]
MKTPRHDGHDHAPGQACGPACHAPHGQPGGIYLVSPSSAVADPATLDLARERLAAEGFKTAVDRSALAVHQRFAGTDKQRLAALTRARRPEAPHRYGYARWLWTDAAAAPD